MVFQELLEGQVEDQTSPVQITTKEDINMKKIAYYSDDIPDLYRSRSRIPGEY